MGISTHVLDTSSGKPAAGVSLNLHRNEPGAGWVVISEAVTDAGGRAGQLIPAGDSLRPGEYRLWFDVRKYFVDGTFFPEVTIHFEIRDVSSHYHVPLLLSPYGYSTYRGS